MQHGVGLYQLEKKGDSCKKIGLLKQYVAHVNFRTFYFGSNYVL